MPPTCLRVWWNLTNEIVNVSQMTWVKFRWLFEAEYNSVDVTYVGWVCLLEIEVWRWFLGQVQFLVGWKSGKVIITNFFLFLLH